MIVSVPDLSDLAETRKYSIFLAFIASSFRVTEED